MADYLVVLTCTTKSSISVCSTLGLFMGSISALVRSMRWPMMVLDSGPYSGLSMAGFLADGPWFVPAAVNFQSE